MKPIKTALYGLALSLSVVLGVPVATAEVQNSITALNVGRSADGAAVVKVEFAQPLDTPPREFTINTPPRIALDFANTANGLGKSSQNFSDDELRSANIVQAGGRTRLVINLNRMLGYATKIEGNTLLLTLKGGAVAATQEVATPQRFAESKQGGQNHALKEVEFHRGKNGEGRIQVDLSDAGVGIDIRQQGTQLIVDFLKTSLPRNLQRKLDVVDFATPVQGVDTFAQGENVRMVIEPKGKWEHAAYQTDNKFIVEVKPVVEDPNKQGKSTQGGYVGEKLTLNFQKIDVREALNVIADFTELNMVISDTVNGNLTLRLKDVPWDQALDIILQSRGLDMRKNGNVIQVAPREELAAKEKIDLTARQEIAELEELRTESFQLSYQKGDAVSALLSNDKQRILSKRGSVVVDPRTNMLFVQDTPSRLDEVRKLIKQVDVPVRQVMIEARFVSATDDFNREIGGKLGFRDATGVVAGGGFGIGKNTANATRGLLGGNVNVPSGAAAAGGALTLSLFNPAATKVLSLELAASELDGKTKNIASPRVVTADKSEATIKAGVQVPYQQASSSGATAIAFKDATLSLKVTPQISPDDNVDMKIDATQDTVGAVYAGVPSINTKAVKTQVMVENGGTVVIGGVFTQDIADTTNKVPLLGDVPVLGWLFKDNVKRDNKSELLIFITPKIVKDMMSQR